MKPIGLALSLPLMMFAAVEGVVTNQTTSKPQPGASVTLIRLGSGMNTIGSVQSDAQGNFRIEQDLQPGTPHLLQAMHQGVTYNTILNPGAASTGIQLAVYNASANASDANVVQHMILIEPTESALSISESIIYSNTGKVTFNAPAGTLRLWVPAGVTTPVRVSVQGPQGMPVQRPAEETSERNTYVVKYPIRPGETRFDVSYSLPAASKFESRILHGGGPVRIVAPQGVTLSGPGVTELQRHQETQAMIYQLQGTAIALTVQGTGSLRASAGARGGEAEGEDNTPGIDQVKPRIYKRVELIVALALLMLAIGFVLLYRMEPNKGVASKRA
jgi:hypothetical protein